MFAVWYKTGIFLREEHINPRNQMGFTNRVEIPAC